MAEIWGNKGGQNSLDQKSSKKYGMVRNFRNKQKNNIGFVWHTME
jgi:hypothetical protein